MDKYVCIKNCGFTIGEECVIESKLNNVIIGEYGPIFSNKNYKSCYVTGKECTSKKEYIYDGPISKYIR